jgi:hypothetical protein
MVVLAISIAIDSNAAEHNNTQHSCRHWPAKFSHFGADPMLDMGYSITRVPPLPTALTMTPVLALSQPVGSGQARSGQVRLRVILVSILRRIFGGIQTP